MAQKLTFGNNKIWAWKKVKFLLQSDLSGFSRHNLFFGTFFAHIWQEV